MKTSQRGHAASTASPSALAAAGQSVPLSSSHSSSDHVPPHGSLNRSAANAFQWPQKRAASRAHAAATVSRRADGRAFVASADYDGLILISDATAAS